MTTRSNHIRSGIGVGLLGLSMACGCTSAPTTNPGVDPACLESGVICTVVGTGFSLFDGDGKAALDTSLYLPLDVAFDSAGRALVLDWNNFRVRRVNEDGTIQSVIGTGFEEAPVDGALAIATPLHHASDIEPDSMGRIYIAGNHAPLVFLVGTNDRVSIVAGNGDYGYDGDGGPAEDAKLGAPFGVTPANDGGFYFADAELHVVRRVDADGIISTVAGDSTPGYSGDGGPANAARINGPTRLRTNVEGALFICDTNNHVIRRVDRDGIITTIAGTGEPGFEGDGGPATGAKLFSPHDLRFSPDGDLYIADAGNNVIRRIDRSGVISTVVGTGTAGFSGDKSAASHCQLDRPSSVVFDSEGAMWISDTYNHRVRKVAKFLPGS